MKRKDLTIHIIAWVPISILISIIALLIITEGTAIEIFKNRVEYPLKQVKIIDDSKYILVKCQYGANEKYEIVTDTWVIKKNKLLFSFYDDGSINLKSADGCIYLYKDGECIDEFLIDTSLGGINYGTLNFQEISKQQYELIIGFKK